MGCSCVVLIQTKTRGPPRSAPPTLRAAETHPVLWPCTSGVSVPGASACCFLPLTGTAFKGLKDDTGEKKQKATKESRGKSLCFAPGRAVGSVWMLQPISGLLLNTQRISAFVSGWVRGLTAAAALLSLWLTRVTEQSLGSWGQCWACSTVPPRVTQ